MHETNRNGLISKFHAELGTRKNSWMRSQRGFLELEKVLGRLFADTRHPEKKNLQASQSSPAMSWQPLKAAEESGGLSIRPGYSHSQAGPTAGIRCQVPTGSTPPTAAALFTLTASWRGGRSPPTTNGQTEAQSHLSAGHRRGQNESSLPQPNS